MVTHQSSTAARKDSPYLTAYKGLMNRLEILDDVNKKLPVSIDSEREKEYSNWIRNVIQEDGQTQADVARIVSRINGDNRRHPIRSRKAGPLVRDLVVTILEYEMMGQFIREMSLIFLISQFETFLQQVISITLQKTPGPIMEKSITLKQLTDCGSITEARRQVIEKEIHEIRLINPDETDNYFSRKFGIRLSASPYWSEFKERFYRRNVLVHRSGIPDQKYFARTGRKRTRGVGVSKDYLATSVNLFSSMARIIARQFQRKFGSEWPQDVL